MIYKEREGKGKMLTAADVKAFQQFIWNDTKQFFKKDVLWKPSHNKLVFSIIHAELFDPISILLLS